MNTTFKKLIFAALSAALLAGCSGKKDPVTPVLPAVKVTRIDLSATSTSAAVGVPVQLTFTAVPTNATDNSVAWSSSDAAVATVDATGKVTGVSAGTAIITATAKDGS
jgi:uncharacterized protein YjdB